MTTTVVPQWEVEIGGETLRAEIATVESFHLGDEDHGMFVAAIMFVGPAWGQALPYFSLDEFDKETKERHGTAFGCDYIIECTRRIGSPEQAKGQRVVVFRRAAYSDIEGFAGLNDDGTFGEPFMPRALAARHKP